jgi:thymidylate synthase
MPITTEVKKFGDTIVTSSKTTLAESTKPLYAFVGANDLAVEKLRERGSKFRSEAKVRSTKLQKRVSSLPKEYKTLPTQVKSYTGTVTDKVTKLFDELTGRGEKVVAQIRRSPATKNAAAKNKQVARSTKATKTSATKAAKADVTAVTDAASHVG